MKPKKDKTVTAQPTTIIRISNHSVKLNDGLASTLKDSNKDSVFWHKACYKAYLRMEPKPDTIPETKTVEAPKKNLGGWALIKQQLSPEHFVYTVKKMFQERNCTV